MVILHAGWQWAAVSDLTPSLQCTVQAAVCARMSEAYTALRASLAALHRRFAGDSEEVQAEWLAFLRRADGQMLEALTACVRRSLHEVARALAGEHRGAEVSPVFVLSIILDTNGRWVGRWVGGRGHICGVLRRCVVWACLWRPAVCSRK